MKTYRESAFMLIIGVVPLLLGSSRGAAVEPWITVDTSDECRTETVSESHYGFGHSGACMDATDPIEQDSCERGGLYRHKTSKTTIVCTPRELVSVLAILELTDSISANGPQGEVVVRDLDILSMKLQEKEMCLIMHKHPVDKGGVWGRIILYPFYVLVTGEFDPTQPKPELHLAGGPLRDIVLSDEEAYKVFIQIAIEEGLDVKNPEEAEEG